MRFAFAFKNISKIYNTILHAVYPVYLHKLDMNSWPGNFEEEDEDLDADPDADADLQVVEEAPKETAECRQKIQL